jgi:hypothetical protein
MNEKLIIAVISKYKPCNALWHMVCQYDAKREPPTVSSPLQAVDAIMHQSQRPLFYALISIKSKSCIADGVVDYVGDA